MMTNRIIYGDAVAALSKLPEQSAQLIIADPPYFQVLVGEAWDNQWKNEDEYLEWSMSWVRAAAKVLKDDGLFYIFGQLGKCEHIWLHFCSMVTKELQFHDMIIWDRAVGYNERYDSFTPCYEMILALRKSESAKPYFNKDAVRLPYEEEKIKAYLRDKRYKDKSARLLHLEKGKYATNILRVPSLKGSSKKSRTPCSKACRSTLEDPLILSSSRPGDLVLDPFLGSGTTAVVAERLERRWIGIEHNADYIRIAEKRLTEQREQNDTPLFRATSSELAS
jgi:DNA modification methylase